MEIAADERRAAIEENVIASEAGENVHRTFHGEIGGVKGVRATASIERERRERQEIGELEIIGSFSRVNGERGQFSDVHRSGPAGERGAVDGFDPMLAGCSLEDVDVVIARVTRERERARARVVSDTDDAPRRGDAAFEDFDGGGLGGFHRRELRLKATAPLCSRWVKTAMDL